MWLTKGDRSLIPSKKEFWLSDMAVPAQDFNSYMRGEKPETAQPIVAWASQTGKGLLFFNKKGDTTKRQPDGVLPLYEATDLKKQPSHEIAFKVHSQEHTLKAANDTERDGWFVSIEKAVETGKASREETHASEGYKSELEKLSTFNDLTGGCAHAKRHVDGPAVATTAATKFGSTSRSQSRPKKSMDGGRTKVDSDAEDEDKTKNKSRSTSRGFLSRFMGSKDETTTKEPSRDEAKMAEDNTPEPVGLFAAVAGKDDNSGMTAPQMVHDGEPINLYKGSSSSTNTISAHDEKPSSDPLAVEPGVVNDEADRKVEETTEEKPKPAKRGSIFGLIPGFGSAKSPSKEKEQKDAELTSTSDDVVSEEPPVLPETATTQPTDTVAEADKIEAKAETELQHEHEQEAKKEAVTTPGKEKKLFLNGLSFMKSRQRSVSPANPAAVQSNAEVSTPKTEATEPTMTDAPVVESAAIEPLEKPAVTTEESSKATTPSANKRQSFIGSLGRRASKAMGYKGAKKENVAPTTEASEESTGVVDATGQPKVNGEATSDGLPAEQKQQQTIGDVVPEAISVGQPQQSPTVTASA